MKRRSKQVRLVLVGAVSATALIACDDSVDFDSQQHRQQRYLTYQQCVQQWQNPEYCERRTDGFYYSPVYIFGGGRSVFYDRTRNALRTAPTSFQPGQNGLSNPVTFKTPSGARIEAPGVRIGRGGFGSSGRSFGSFGG
jgi:hypothetical protein